LGVVKFKMKKKKKRMQKKKTRKKAGRQWAKRRKGVLGSGRNHIERENSGDRRKGQKRETT